MPEILEKCVTKLQKQGKSKSSAYAICTATLKKAGKLTEEEANAVYKEQELTFSDVEDAIKLSDEIDVEELLKEETKDKFSVMTEITLAEDNKDDEFTEIEMLRSGHFKHTYYGDLVFDEKYFKHLKKNFDNNVIEREISFDREHYITDGAVAWLKEVNIVKRGKDKNAKHYLVGKVEFTSLGKTAIKDKLYKYFSIDYTTNYTDKEDETKTYGPTIYGGALTNRPYIPGLRPISMGDRIEMSEKDLEAETYDEVVLSQEDDKQIKIKGGQEEVVEEKVDSGADDKKAANKKFNVKEERPLSAKELLEKQLSDLIVLRDSVKKDSEEYTNLNDKIKTIQDAISDLDIKFKELEDKPKETPKEEEKVEEKPEVKPKLSEEKPKEEEKVEEEEVKMTDKDNEEIVKLREKLKAHQEAISVLTVEKRKSDVEKTVLQFRQKGVPPVLIGFYEEVALTDTDDEVITLSDGKNKGAYTLSGVLIKLFDLLPPESLIDLSEHTETLIPEDESVKIVQGASDKVKGKKAKKDD